MVDPSPAPASAVGRPLRFCMVTTFYPPYHFGGDGIFVYRLAHALARKGHEVDVVHSIDAYRLQHPGRPEVDFAEHPNVRRFPLETRRPMLSSLLAHQAGGAGPYAARLREVLEGQEHDVIHYHNVSLVGGPGVLRLGGALKLYTPHEYWLVCPTHVLFRYGREACTRRTCLSCTLLARRPPQAWRWSGHLERCAAEVDCFLMPSRFALERHRADGLRGRMQVMQSFVPRPPEVVAVPPVPYFLYAGRLETLKGAGELPAIFEPPSDAELWIAGSGALMPELQRRAQGHPRVKLLGSVHPSRVSELYAGAVAVVVPSLCYEVFPLVVAEALAHGAPVVARRIGAIPEVVEESGGGLLFDTMDECRALMGELLHDHGRRLQLAQRGRSHAATHWTEEAYLGRYLPLVDELLAERRATAQAAGARA